MAVARAPGAAGPRAAPTLPRLIAHRGDAERYPENTLAALDAAVAAGVPAVEFDLQMTADGVPVLLHDASLARTAGVDADIRALTLRETRGLGVGEPSRFGRRHARVPLPTLAEVVERMPRWRGVTCFVEIKEESTDHFGIERVTRRVMELLSPVRERCVVISFSAAVLRVAARLGAASTGWCMEQMGAAERETAAALNPEVLLADWRAIPDTGLWTGRWQWALWEVVDPALAVALAARGARWVETMAPASMLSRPPLAPRG